MSSRRSIVWLLFFVAMAVAAHVLVTVRANKSGVAQRADALAPDSDGATLLEIARRGAPPAVVLRTDRWRLIEPFPAAVDAGVLLRLLDTLAFKPVTAVLTEPEMRRLGRTFADFGLEKPVLGMSVRRGLEETRIRFGNRTPAGDGVYASVSDRPGVCVVASNDFAALDVSLNDLRSPCLLPENRGEVSAMDIRRAAGHFVRVSRTAEGVWRMLEPMQAAVSPSRVESFLKLLDGARTRRFIWPVAGEGASRTPSVSLLAGYGLDSESAVTVTLTEPGGASHTLSFGKNADGESVYALVQEAGAIAIVPAALRDRLLAAADSFADMRIFPYDEKEIVSLSIADGDVIYLVARSPEGAWRIDSPVSAPADQDVVRALVRTVLSLRTTERDEKGLRVSVSTNAPAVSVSRDALLVQNRLEDLRSKTVLRFPPDGIRRLSTTAEDGRQASAVWDAANRTWLMGKPDGATLDGLALARVLGALDPLTARSIVRLRIAASEMGNYGLEHPRFTVAVDPLAEGSVRRNILIGSAAPGGGSYATVGSTDAVVVLPDETVRALMTPFASVEP